MNSDEILKKLVPIANEPLFPTSSPSLFRSEWKPMQNGRFCSIYGIYQGSPIATVAICLPGEDESTVLNEAIKRIEGHGCENPEGEEAESS